MTGDTLDNKTQRTKQTVDCLREMILGDEFSMGEALRQTEIAETLKVSRTPVREALKQLAQEGLVTISETGRTTVTPIDPDYLQELYDVRCQLEMWLIELAIPLMLPEDIEAARQLNRRLALCKQEEWGDLNHQFHMTLYRAANKPHTLDLLSELSQRTTRRLRKPIYMLRNTERSIREHDELINLCAAMDVQAAKERLESHILLNSRALIDRLRAVQRRS